jgi:hypothetical protein
LVSVRMGIQTQAERDHSEHMNIEQLLDIVLCAANTVLCHMMKLCWQNPHIYGWQRLTHI